jgi:hypothetical protein
MRKLKSATQCLCLLRAAKSFRLSLQIIIYTFLILTLYIVKDFAGNQWWIATHVEDVSPEEMERRSKEAMEKRKEQK